MAPPISRISPDICLAEISKFDTIIDVRSPSEFADDHIPGAINLPVLDDQQRGSWYHLQTNQSVQRKTCGRRFSGAKYCHSFADSVTK